MRCPCRFGKVRQISIIVGNSGDKHRRRSVYAPSVCHVRKDFCNKRIGALNQRLPANFTILGTCRRAGWRGRLHIGDRDATNVPPRWLVNGGRQSPHSFLRRVFYLAASRSLGFLEFFGEFLLLLKDAGQKATFGKMHESEFSGRAQDLRKRGPHPLDDAAQRRLARYGRALHRRP